MEPSPEIARVRGALDRSLTDSHEIEHLAAPLFSVQGHDFGDADGTRTR